MTNPNVRGERGPMPAICVGYYDEHGTQTGWCCAAGAPDVSATNGSVSLQLEESMKPQERVSNFASSEVVAECAM